MMMNHRTNHNDRSRRHRLLGLFLGVMTILASFVFMQEMRSFLTFSPMQQDDGSEDDDETAASFPFSLSNTSASTTASMDIATTTTTTPAFTLTSPAFAHGDAISPLFVRTSSTNDVSPPLKWSNIPNGTESLVLILEDNDDDNPDATPNDPEDATPSRIKTPWVHWVLYNLPPTASQLPVGVGGVSTTSRKLPSGTMQGLNDWKQAGYVGPSSSSSSPPSTGSNSSSSSSTQHRYFFKLYALDIVLDDNTLQQQHQQHEQHLRKAKAAATKAMVVQAMQGHVLGQAELIGTCKK
jgi:Raf kinase inhibitor-like YbhB/YbcL family protein